MTYALGRIDHKEWTKILTHFLVIMMLLVLPEVLLGYSRPDRGGPISNNWTLYIKSGLYVAIFYINYFLLLRNTLLSSPRHIWKFIGWNLLIIAVVIVCLYFSQFLNSPEIHEGAKRTMRMRHMGPPIEDPSFSSARMKLLRSASFWIKDIGMAVMTIALAVALKLGENWSAIEHRHQQMLATQKAEELTNLKSQLNPHFLFNTLNTIYALISVSPEQAQKAIHQLSSLLRYVLYENPPAVTLSQEIEFVKSYISLMEMRLPTGTVKAEFYQQSPNEVKVPPLLFISLIENAFKHGNTGNPKEPISITIASLTDGTVVCKTSNYFVTSPQSAKEKEGGIGTANLRRRLQLIYGDRACLNTTIDGNQYIAMLTINPQNS